MVRPVVSGPLILLVLTHTNYHQKSPENQKPFALSHTLIGIPSFV